MSMNITMLKTELLYHHPNNPREEYDDLEDLAASLRINGVLQNLTVVPYSPADHSSLTPADPANAYVVVIGNRRLEGSRLAGLTEVPCVINTTMDLREQLLTMEQENGLRKDTSPYLQAQNYQMLIDLGETVESLSAKSGISTTTIRNRIGLLVLKKEKFDAAQERGAKLTDYLVLNKLKDHALRNKVLDAIGTKNFARELDNALYTEKRREFMQDSLDIALTFAKQIDSAEAVPGIRVVDVYAWWKANKVSVPSDEDLASYQYYFVKSGEGENMEIRVYTTKPAPAVVVDEEQIKRKEAEEKQKAEIKVLNGSTYKLRFSFIKDLPHTKAKKNFGLIAKFISGAVRTRDDATVYYEQTPWRINYQALAELLDINYDANAKAIDEDALSASLLTNPEYTLLCIAYTQYDKADKSYIKNQWCAAKQVYEPVYNPNEALDRVYFLLEKLGYEISDEELALINGNHDIFADEDEPAEAVGETPVVAEVAAATSAAEVPAPGTAA